MGAVDYILYTLFIIGILLWFKQLILKLSPRSTGMNENCSTESAIMNDNYNGHQFYCRVYQGRDINILTNSDVFLAQLQ